MRTVAILLLLIALSFNVSAESAKETAAKIASQHGLAKWNKVENIEFTFVATLPSKNLTVSRSWKWAPKTGEVTLVDENHTYNVKAITDADKKTDAKFINDSYWLLFPYRMVWDRIEKLELAAGKVKGPLTQKPLRKLTVQYGDVGYTPGDAYDVFFDSDYQIREWIFRKSGTAEPTRQSTWEGYKVIGGLTLATEHKGPGGFRIEFKNVLIR